MGCGSPERRQSPRRSNPLVMESRVTHLARAEKEAKERVDRVTRNPELDDGAGVLSNSGKKAVATVELRAAAKELLEARREKKRLASKANAH